MIYVGIDVAKLKHDCFIIDSNGEVYRDVFTIENSLDGFTKLHKCLICHPQENVKIGLESTGHYSKNLIKFLSDKGYDLTVMNPLTTNLKRKAQSLRKTKTDKIDAKTIAKLLFANDSKSYSPLSYHMEELKSLTRHRSRLVKHSSRLKISLTRLVDIVFPELPSILNSIHQKSIYALLLDFTTPVAISSCHITRLTNLLRKHSRGGHGKSMAMKIKSLAKRSIGSSRPSLALELRQTIRLIDNIKLEIDLVEAEIVKLMDEISSPILSLPGISYIYGSIIISEIGDISRFSSPAKLLAFAGLEPSTNQSGSFFGSQSRMVKRGSSYLRYALLGAAGTIIYNDPIFNQYYLKKRAEGKHRNVALSHVARKLVRVIFHLLKNNHFYVPQLA